MKKNYFELIKYDLDLNKFLETGMYFFHKDDAEDYISKYIKMSERKYYKIEEKKQNNIIESLKEYEKQNPRLSIQRLEVVKDEISSSISLPFKMKFVKSSNMKNLTRIDKTSLTLKQLQEIVRMGGKFFIQKDKINGQIPLDEEVKIEFSDKNCCLRTYLTYNQFLELGNILDKILSSIKEIDSEIVKERGMLGIENIEIDNF